MGLGLGACGLPLGTPDRGYMGGFQKIRVPFWVVILVGVCIGVSLFGKTTRWR